MKEQTISSAMTSMNIQAGKADIWKKVGFYEHVNKQPSWLLRLSLPVPQQVEGQYSNVGDICRCRYSDGGYLTKRITRLVDQNRIEFEIIEQSIRFQDTVKLLGGYIEVEEVDESRSIVNMVTYYENRISPTSISSIFIDKVIKTMHQFVIEDMQQQLQDKFVGASVAMGSN
ncbi:MAG: hypothetical protein A3I66_20660 [Burkholderiales bacterium RIFCSPLOWO2_02_FULL_57_36]|nr:MAG: hypothetical protein A3I66_20660 [Burkholderiales bacterium RIFCSPLOWO2_02_FULL_57_36]